MLFEAVRFLHVMLALLKVNTSELSAVKEEVHVTLLQVRSTNCRVWIVPLVTVTEAMFATVLTLVVGEKVFETLFVGEL
eukprot:49105-Eustigmatos_ZCMA.PRE.1